MARNTISNTLILISILAFGPAHAQEPDWMNYAKVLREHVVPGSKNGTSLTLIDYEALRLNGAINRLAAELSAFNVDRLQTRDEQLAFYINAYNILAIKVVLDNWPVKSIKDAGSFFSPVWDKDAGQLAGRRVTLGEIEHKILRPMGEPRIHFAIVCASVSCPDLRAEPYLAEDLNRQLDDQSRNFLDNVAKGLRRDGSVYRVSKIFDWFEEDFVAQGGVVEFVRSYKTEVPSHAKVKADLPYDWQLNTRGE